MILSPLQNTAGWTTAWIQKRPRITQEFGMTNYAKTGAYGKDKNGNNRIHNGLDFGVPTGTKLFSPFDGQIKIRKDSSGYGWHIKLRSKSKHLECVMSHLSGFKEGLTDGQNVNLGDCIGYTGNTGMSTGSHLHLGVRRLRPSDGDVFNWSVENYNDNSYGYIDPMPYLIWWKGAGNQKTL